MPYSSSRSVSVAAGSTHDASSDTARTITDYQEKQDLLRTLYEQFFQAYSRR